MDETLKERIKLLGLDEDDEKYLFSRDKEILARLSEIADNEVLEEIVYSLIDEDIMAANYSKEIILTFIDACAYNFAYEEAIYKVLCNKECKTEEQLLMELRLLAKAKSKIKIDSIESLFKIEDLPLKEEFGDAILNAKEFYGAHSINIMAHQFYEQIKEAPYYYLEVAKIVSNVKNARFTCFIDFVIATSAKKWVSKNNCLHEMVSKFTKGKNFFQLYFICELFELLPDDSSIIQIENVFKGVDLIPECSSRFQAEAIWKYYRYCFVKNITPDIEKAKTFLTVEKENTATFVEEMAEKDKMDSTSLLDSASVLNNSHRKYNFNYATHLLVNPEYSEYGLSAAHIINEVTEEEKAKIIGFILCENNPNSLEIAAIGNTLYEKYELEALKLLNHSTILNEMGVSILMARIIGRVTDYNYDIVALYEILKDEVNKEKVVSTLRSELSSKAVKEPSKIADLFNQILGTTTNANYHLVDEDKPKENKDTLKKVLTKFKRRKK